MYKENSDVVNFVLCMDNNTWLFNLICDFVLVILFWMKHCLCFCHSIQDNLCKDNSTWIICLSLCLLKVAVLVLAAMVYGLCMFGCTCTCMLAGFLQLKPLMKTSFTIATLLVSYLITYEITYINFIGSICYLNVNLMVCDRATL